MNWPKNFPQIWSRELAAKASWKKFSKELTNEKVTFSGIFLLFLGVLLWIFYHDVFAASSRSKICEKKFWIKNVPMHFYRDIRYRNLKFIYFHYFLKIIISTTWVRLIAHRNFFFTNLIIKFFMHFSLMNIYSPLR